MWFSPDAIREALARSATLQPNPGPETLERAHQRALKEKAIYASGVAECSYCHEEIRYHPNMSPAGWTWESEYLIGWCESSRDKKHHPKIIFEEEENDD